MPRDISRKIIFTHQKIEDFKLDNFKVDTFEPNDFYEISTETDEEENSSVIDNQQVS